MPRTDHKDHGWDEGVDRGIPQRVTLEAVLRMTRVIRSTFVKGPLAALLGALTVLALPPFSLLPFLVLGLGGLFLLLCRAGPAAAVLTGWSFGMGYFIAGIHWIGESFFVDAERFGWMAAPAVGGLSAFLALFIAIPAWIFARLRWGGVADATVFALLWTASEWLRGHVLTGFPWNLVAYAWVDHPAPRQIAAVFGSYGLSLLTVFAAVLMPLSLLATSRRDRHSARMAALLALLILAAGALRLPPDSGEDGIARAEDLSGPLVRIVQGNIPQVKKWLPEQRAATVERYLDLSSRPGRYDLLLWPETAYPGFLDEAGEMLARIAARLPPGAHLLAGTPRRSYEPTGRAIWNAVITVNDGGGIEGVYDKHHLVPFGEYVPLRGVLPLNQFTAGFGDFSAGPGPRTLQVGAQTVGVAICYEAIFPGELVDRTRRPDWIFNPTNDAWFGTSIGPDQHLASARMRAVEEGLPMVRAANTGISAVIDGYGTISAKLPLNETGIVDARLPPPLSPTPYARWGDLLLVPLALAVVLSSVLVGGWKGRLRARPPARQPSHGSGAA
ncbi:apolipoprotein N-acyltransferase [Azospirillum sp. TSO5]|uniref:apolipoprotein N-acyltransferase n=1 Tax=Azospirillum sp. TSO5 TaxID=716760 RepID=UPI0018EE6409|nr:apolipoprotein N-acyltransferase [Azospirillum sp. TSO5]